jgi:hypothetical protein
MKNKIKELIDQATILSGKKESWEIAKYLVQNNVVQLPCKIGDTLYLKTGERAKVIAIYIDKAGGMFDLMIESNEESVGVKRSFVCRDYTFDDIGLLLFYQAPRKDGESDGES